LFYWNWVNRPLQSPEFQQYLDSLFRNLHHALALIASVGMDRRAWIALGATAAAAGCTYAAYHYLYQKRLTEESKVELVAVIEQVHIDFLENIAANHTGGDVDRTLARILEHAMSDADENELFEFVRCSTCGSKDKKPITASIATRHERFLVSMAEKHALKKGKDKALRIVFDYAMTDGVADSIFGSG
jgi:homoserine kinase